MTTPTRDALNELVGVLRLAADTDHQHFGEGVCQWCGYDVDLCDEEIRCAGWKMRAVLSAWESRAPLHRDEALLDKLTTDFAEQVGAGEDEAGEVALLLLKWFESHLLGTPGTGEGGERRG